MKLINRPAGAFILLVAGILCCAGLALTAYGRDSPLSKDVAPLLQKMVGTWDVKQRMWPSADADAVNLPPAIARRRLVDDAYLEETMELAKKSEEGSFTRTSYINYNTVEQQYEYFSLDSRAPQQMGYKSDKREKSDTSSVKLKGGTFVASQWGDTRNVAFGYRLSVGQVEKDHQVVQLYLTPLKGAGKEFLAFEYIYTREH